MLNYCMYPIVSSHQMESNSHRSLRRDSFPLHKKTPRYITDPVVNSQLLEEFVIKTDYIFIVHSSNEKFDHVTEYALKNIKM